MSDKTEEEKFKELENSEEFQEYKRVQGELGKKRIEIITRMIKQHFAALTPSGKLNAIEMYQLGVNAIMAGYSLVSRYSDMMNENAEERKDLILRTKLTIDNMLNESFLKENVLQQQVANTAIHNLKANKLIK